ncbi:fumarylacetoacetate hydrolase family protein [Sphingomonas sp. Root710]|uniref:fumarylacetoacetate hydrolase family protein n=1 Tax=Sphingomonas sp. Root710 TaxID=1736594 RepID=UPI001910DAFB|nr:fumarylacetoacetate hydrolase family protein [Sphingomonas sp. Root710]
MRYLSYRFEGKPGWGRIEGDRVVPLEGVHPSLKAAIVAGALGTEALRNGGAATIALSDVEFAPLVTDPGKILCVGLNYENHRRETGRAEVKHPTIFTRFADSQTGHRTPILRPRESTRLDYEGELAIVIGKAGRRIPAAEAFDHIAGYSCYNDGSIRDWQAHTIQFGPGKNFPQTGAFGPWLVTPDEFGKPGPQRIQTRLNGEVMQSAVFDDMIFPIERLVEYCSTFTPLSPGDVIVTGTPGGVGAKRDPQVFMKPGDKVEIEIDGIGILENSIADD